MASFFYASLAVALPASHKTPGWLGLMACWMTGIVLAWDLAMAALMRHPSLVHGFERTLPALEVFAGVLFVVLGASGLINLMR